MLVGNGFSNTYEGVDVMEGTPASADQNATKNFGNDTSVLERAMAEFARSVEITRDVRFQANLRLARRQRASSYVISFLSLYVIALSLVPNVVELRPFQSQILLACSVILSVFIIFTSLIDASQIFFIKVSSSISVHGRLRPSIINSKC